MSTKKKLQPDQRFKPIFDESEAIYDPINEQDGSINSGNKYYFNPYFYLLSVKDILLS